MATIHVNPDFHADEAATELQQAMKGLGTNENVVIAVIAKNHSDQRQLIKEAYKAKFGKDLDKELTKELKGDFEDVVTACMLPPRVYDAHTLKHAMKGIGTKEDALVEVMCTRTPDEMAKVKASYHEQYGKDLEGALKKETKGTFQRLLVSECSSLRQVGDEVDEERAMADARAIFQAGKGQMGTDESVISEVLTTRSHAQLRATFKAYYELANEDIEKAIRREAMGHVQDGWLACVGIAKNMAEFYADGIHEALKGIGTRDSMLIRIIVSRSEVDLGRIREVYTRKYGTPLEVSIKKNCSGYYCKMLEAIVIGNQ